MGCGASVASKYPSGPTPPRAENRVEPAAIEVATTVMTPKVAVQPMGDIDAPIQRGLSLSYGSCTIPGYDPARPRKPNQDDSLIVEQFQHQSQSFFAVMDGHGTAGHEVARYAKQEGSGLLYVGIFFGLAGPQVGFLHDVFDILPLVEKAG